MSGKMYKLKSSRAAWHDYSASGAYFIAIGTHEKERLFGRIEHGAVRLSAFGEIVREEWERSFAIRKELACDFVMVLPDQVYGVVRISEAGGTHGHAFIRRAPLQRESKSISTFVAGFKTAVTKRINEQRGTPMQKVWQNRYYDHIFRTQKEHDFILRFLRLGPLRSSDTVRAILESNADTHTPLPFQPAVFPQPSPAAAFFPLPPALERAAEAAMARVAPRFRQIEATTEFNQQKVLRAFINNRVGESHFAGSTGYGYGDRGREALEAVLAEVLGAESALMRHTFVSGTHTLAVALFGLLRPGDVMLNLTGTPYDTLHAVLGLKGAGMGSLKDFGIQYEQVDLDANGRLDFDSIKTAMQKHRPRLVYLQRSRGYTLRPSLFVEELGEAAKLAKQLCDCIVMADNCYGEFVQREEPTQAGVDLIAGSLIKNPGGGVARNGGYIAGRRDLVELCAYRMTVPGLGREIGATLGVNRDLFMGLFHAPHVVGEALKTAVFAAALLEELGFEASPRWDEPRADIIQSLQLGTPEALVAFCRGVQSGAPVDSFVTPEPWDMPGYDSQVIMAAGAFILGSSIELSADAPLREPYAVWLQGGLNFHSGKIGVLMGAKQLQCTMDNEQ